MTCMTDQNVFNLPSRPAGLRRPAVLIRAARAGQAGWQRVRDLPRLLGRDSAPAHPAALRMLRAAEAAADRDRRAGRADYDLHRHVRLLIALLAEMNAAQSQAPQPVPCLVLGFSVRGTARPEPHA